MAESQTSRLGTGDRIAVTIGCLAAAVAIAVVSFEHAYPDATTATWRVILYVAIVVAIAAVFYLIFDLVVRPRLGSTLSHEKLKIRAILVSLLVIIAVAGGLWYASTVTPRPAARLPLRPASVSPSEASTPDHPPVLKGQAIEIKNGDSYILDYSTLNDPNAKSFVETKEPKNIVLTGTKEPPSLLSLFVNDAKGMIAQGAVFHAMYDVPTDKWGNRTRIFYCVFFDFNGYTRFYSVYVPETSNKSALLRLLAHQPEFLIKTIDQTMGMEMNVQGQSGPPILSWHFKFSGVVYVYTEIPYLSEERESAIKSFGEHAAAIQFRSAAYARDAFDNIKLKTAKPLPLYVLSGNPALITPVLKSQ